MAQNSKDEKKEVKRPVGRPTLYSTELAEEVCGLIASHPLGYERIYDMYHHIPSPQTIQNWIRKHPEFLGMYLRAKEIQSHILLDRTLDIANIPSSEEDSLLKVNRDKLKIDTFKFNAVRLNPRNYGDKQESTHNVNVTETKQKVRDADSEYKY